MEEFVKESLSVDKPMPDQMFAGFENQIAEVLAFGASKYGRENYMLCGKDNLHLYRDALLRHTTAYRSGELNDPETGLSHLAHAACNLMFIYKIENTKLCSSCKQYISNEKFHKSSSSCKQCKIDWLFKKPDNFITSVYARLVTRSKLTKHKELGFTKEEFLDFSLNSRFMLLYDKYSEDRDIKRRPELDRIDSTKGYTVDNVQWLTNVEHACKSANELTDKAKKHSIYTINKFKVGEYTEKEAWDYLGMSNYGHKPSNGLFWYSPSKEMIISSKIKTIATALLYEDTIDISCLATDNKSGFKSVIYRANRPKKFIAKPEGYHLGSFNTGDEAAEVILNFYRKGKK